MNGSPRLTPTEHGRGGGLWAATVDETGLTATAEDFARVREARLADLFVSENVMEETADLRVVYALDRECRYVVVRCPLSGTSFPLLSDIHPGAFVEECEIYEQTGIRPDGEKPLNRVHMAPNMQSTFTRLRPVERQRLTHQHAPHRIQGQAFEFPFGPVRAAGWESLYMGLVTTGEEVLDLYLFHWHKHRAAERRMTGARLAQALFWAERLEGLCAVGNGVAFCAAAEAAAGIPACEQGLRIRGVAMELERIYNHTAAVAAMCQATGLSVGQADTEIVLEQMLRLNVAAFGHRYLFGIACPGGASLTPDIAVIREQLPRVCKEFEHVVDALLRTNSFVDRLEATGRLTAEDARRLGLVGPVARACGIALDVRHDHPVSGSEALPGKPVTGSAGDALARMQVMCEEISVARGLVLDALDSIDPGVRPARDFDPQLVAGRDGLGWAESARGEVLCWLSFDEAGRVRRARLRPASARNWRAFDEAARARNVFTDVPIIEASFWLTVAGVAG